MKCTHLAYAHVGLVGALQTKFMDPSSCHFKLKGNKEALPKAAARLPGVPVFERSCCQSVRWRRAYWSAIERVQCVKFKKNALALENLRLAGGARLGLKHD